MESFTFIIPPIRVFDLRIKICCHLQGTEGYEKHMDRLMELSEYMVKKIKLLPDKFYLILEPEMVNVSFWYIPKRLRSMPHNAERVNLLGQVRL